MARLRLAAIGMVVLLGTGGLLLAQDKKVADDKDMPPRTGTGKLPANFKKLGLSDAQLKKVREIHATYSAKIDDLQQQVKSLQREEKSKLNEVLTDEQRARLRDLRTGETGTPPARVKEEKSEKKEEAKTPTEKK